jgi:hypothetical protein
MRHADVFAGGYLGRGNCCHMPAISCPMTNHPSNLRVPDKMEGRWPDNHHWCLPSARRTVPRTSSFDSIVKSRTRWLALSEAWHSPSKFELSKSNSQYYVHSTVIPWPSSFMPRRANLIPVTNTSRFYSMSHEGFQMKHFKWRFSKWKYRDTLY